MTTDFWISNWIKKN